MLPVVGAQLQKIEPTRQHAFISKDVQSLSRLLLSVSPVEVKVSQVHFRAIHRSTTFRLVGGCRCHSTSTRPTEVGDPSWEQQVTECDVMAGCCCCLWDLMMRINPDDDSPLFPVCEREEVSAVIFFYFSHATFWSN